MIAAQNMYIFLFLRTLHTDVWSLAQEGLKAMVARVGLKLVYNDTINPSLYPPVGRGSLVGIATCYRLDGPGIESRCGRDFPHPSRLALGSSQPPIQWLPCISRR